MRTATLTLVASGVAALASLPPLPAYAAPALVPQVSAPAIQPVWYDRWGRWHPPYPYYRPPPYYGYGYGPAPVYAYPPPPPPYGYWRWRRAQCYRWGAC